MPKITVTTNEGIIIDVFNDTEHFDLGYVLENRGLAQTNLIEYIVEALQTAKQFEKDEAEKHARHAFQPAACPTCGKTTVHSIAECSD